MTPISGPGATLDIVLRALTIGSTCVLVGLLPIALLVLRTPAGAAPSSSDRIRPEVFRLRQALRVAALVGVVAAAGSAVRLVQKFHVLAPEQSLVTTLGDVLRSDLGAWTLLRLPAVLALAYVLRTAWAAGRPTPGPHPAVWAPLAALLCLTLPMTGHAWARAGAAGVALDVVHITAGSVWLAGVIALAVVVPAGLRTRHASARRDALLGAAVAFSRVAVVAVAVAVASGVGQAALEGLSFADIAGTTWGTAAAAKLWLFAAVLAAGVVNHRVLIRRLDRAGNRVHMRASSSLLLTAVSLELVLGVALVLAAALLVSVPQP